MEGDDDEIILYNWNHGFFFYRNIYESPNIVPLLICMQYKYVGICLQCIFCLFTFRLSNRRAAIDPLHRPVTHTGTVLAHLTQWAKNVKYSEKIEVCSRDYSITSEAENIARCSTPTSWNTKIATYETWKKRSRITEYFGKLQGTRFLKLLFFRPILAHYAHLPSFLTAFKVC